MTPPRTSPIAWLARLSTRDEGRPGGDERDAAEHLRVSWPARAESNSGVNISATSSSANSTHSGRAGDGHEREQRR